MRTRKSWREKLERPQPAKVVNLTGAMARRFNAGTMLIPCGSEVDALIRKVPKGRLITFSQIRSALAHAHGAGTTCPLVTGIMVRIAAEAAEEDLRGGARRVTPWWRVIRDDGSLNPKLPGGGKAQAARLRAEGYRIQAGAGRRPPRVTLAKAV